MIGKQAKEKKKCMFLGAEQKEVYFIEPLNVWNGASSKYEKEC